MSPEAVTAERIHRELKRLLCTSRFAPGLPLTVQSLANEFGTSISPVRDALNRLVGERLINVQGGGGFAMPFLSRRTAFNLYSWHAEITLLIIKVMVTFEPVGDPPEEIVGVRADPSIIESATAELFTRLAACSPNPEHQEAINSVADRLARFRLHEGAITKQGGELLTLWNIAQSGNRSATRTAMMQYHRKRLMRVDEISAAASRMIDLPPPSGPIGLLVD